jgi:hypothetical protein
MNTAKNKNRTCRVFAVNKTRHPVTQRKFVSNRGVYAQIDAMCREHAEKTQGPNWGQKIFIKNIIGNAKNVEARIAFKKVMGDFLAQAASACLEPGNPPRIRDKAGNPLLYFDRRIGGKSNFGIAHVHTGRGYYAAPKFASKIMDITKDSATEVEIMKKMTAAVVAGYTPNFPIMYSVRKCLDAPKKPYFLMLSELADTDVRSWLRLKKRSTAEWTSVLIQMILAIFAIHELGYLHNDTHYGNFLIHEIPPGGYWRYDLGKKKVFVKNVGFLVVLWDMGLGETYDPRTADPDYMWVEYQSIGHPPKKMWRGAPLPPRDISAFMDVAMMDGTSGPARKEVEYVYGLCKRASSTFGKDVVVVAGSPPPRDVINEGKPYLVHKDLAHMHNHQ